MKFIFDDRDSEETYKGWVYPPEDKPVEFSSLEEFVLWTKKVGLPRHSFVPPGGRIDSKYGGRNRSEYWLVFCEGGYD
jgi:hypothetical protein